MVDDNTLLPYTAEQYQRDVRSWCQATEVDERRQGPLLKLAIGGQARLLLEELEEREGPNIFVEGKLTPGGQQLSGPQLITEFLKEQYPANDESMMLRTGL